MGNPRFTAGAVNLEFAKDDLPFVPEGNETLREGW